MQAMCWRRCSGTLAVNLELNCWVLLQYVHEVSATWPCDELLDVLLGCEHLFRQPILAEPPRNGARTRHDSRCSRWRVLRGCHLRHLQRLQHLCWHHRQRCGKRWHLTRRRRLRQDRQGGPCVLHQRPWWPLHCTWRAGSQREPLHDETAKWWSRARLGRPCTNSPKLHEHLMHLVPSERQLQASTQSIGVPSPRVRQVQKQFFIFCLLSDHATKSVQHVEDRRVRHGHHLRRLQQCGKNVRGLGTQAHRLALLQ
mmetsp:Transcript_61165/g.162522  ORF Transcript_61165/g.162522 Transcript_61165/m.162522 type:complete len:255 (-) Transcript_61165:4773-5537(-)